MSSDYEEAQLLRALIAEDADHCKRSYRYFIEAAWNTVEPGVEFKGNWHIDAMCDALTAVSNKDVTRLIINIPPRHMKSIATSVCWLPWVWTWAPQTRFLAASYSKDLSIRDSVAGRRLVESSWYKERFGNVFQLTSDQNVKSRYENDKRGYRVSTSVDSGLTGEGGDIILCFPYDELLITDAGVFKIGEFVEKKLTHRVLCKSSEGGVIWDVPTAWHKNPPKPMVRVVLSTGEEVTCTRNHEFFTSNRGYVKACELSSLDTLPGFSFPDVADGLRVNPKFSGQGLIRTGGIFYFFDLFLGKFLNAIPPRVSFGACDSGPHPSPTDAVYAAGPQPKFFGQGGCCLGGLLNKLRLLLSYFLSGPNAVKRSVLLRVLNVVGVRSVVKVVKSIVCAISVFVQTQHSWWPRAYKCFKDALVDVNDVSFTVCPSTKPKVSLSVPARLKNAFRNVIRCFGGVYRSTNALHSPQVGNFVARETSDRNPVLVVDVEVHSDSYCISTSHNNFFIGLCQVLVHNCDDPHNAREANSAVSLSSVSEWWDQAMSTRLNDPKTGAYVVIMQRLHDKDLVGHILAKEQGWDHLVLPARYEKNHVHQVKSSLGFKDPRTKEGELIWPERFGEAEVKELERKLGTYGASGQLQQRPVPRGGGIVKVDWFRLWPAKEKLPKFEWVIQSYDTAFTDRTANDPTACTVWGVFKMPNKSKFGVMLIDAWSEHLSYPDLRRRVATDYFESEYGELARKADEVLIEEKGSGISLIRDLGEATRGGERVHIRTYNPGRADKTARLTLCLPQLEEGLVWVPESSGSPNEPVSWSLPLMIEASKFPKAERDDLLDSMTQVLIRLKDMKFVTVDDPFDDEDDYNPPKERRNPYAA